MHRVIKLSAAILASKSISLIGLSADAFAPPLRLHNFNVDYRTNHNQLDGKKRKGSFLDEFSEDDPLQLPPKMATQEDNFHSDMITWLKQNPLTYINPKFKILPSELGGYGGFCSPTLEKIIKQNEMIMCIPRQCCVTLDDATNDERCGGAFRMIQEYQLPDWQLLLVAGWAAKEYMLANVSADKSKIKHWPYLKTLPWKQGDLNQEHVLFWSDDEVESLLKESFGYDDAQLTRSRVQNSTKLLDDLAIGPLLREEMGLDASASIKGFNETVSAAFVSALSRSFAEEVEVDNPDGSTEIEKETLMIPLLDMLQHSNEPNTLVETYDDYIILKAKRLILPGEELFHQYQEENDDVIPPYKFFTRYGFVPGVKKPVVDLLKDKSPIFFDEDWYSQFYGS